MRVGPKVSLYDMLDHLVMTEAGSSIAQDFNRSLLANGHHVGTVGVVRGETASVPGPFDTFDRAVIDTVGHVRSNSNPHYGAWGTGDRFVANGAVRSLPSLIVDVLARAADAAGVVDAARAGQILGPKAQSLVAHIAESLSQPTRRLSSNPKTKWHALPTVATQRLIAASMGGDRLLERMPALAMLERTLGAGAPLKNVRIAAIQHLFPTTATLLEALRRAGASHVSVLGKPYSTDADVVRSLDAKGFSVCESGSESETVIIEERCAPGAGRRQTVSREDYIRRWLGDELAALGPGEKLLLLDDGAKLISALHRYFPSEVHRCIAVEQTMRGVQVIDADVGTPRCPVVDVARSPAKKATESPMIGESVVAAIESMLLQANPTLSSTEKRSAVVLGFGAVGVEVAASLKRRGHSVHVWDSDPTRRAAAQAAGYLVGDDRQETLKHGALLIGCTGRGSLRFDEYDLLPDGAVLANAASDNHELGCDDAAFTSLRGMGSVYNDMTRWATLGSLEVKVGDAQASDPTRSHVVSTSSSGKQQLVLCSGYVVNMAHDIPPAFIQLTRSLLYAACLQAVHETDAGLVPLWSHAQRKIVDVVEHDLARQRLSLRAPDFRGLAGPPPVFQPRQFESALEAETSLLKALRGNTSTLLSRPGFANDGIFVWELEQMLSEARVRWLDWPLPADDLLRVQNHVKTLEAASAAAVRHRSLADPRDSGDWLLLRMELELIVVEERCAGSAALRQRLAAARDALKALPAKREADRIRLAQEQADASSTG